MNKKEVIEEIEKEKSNFNAWEHSVRNRALDDALAIVRKLDEPEKPDKKIMNKFELKGKSIFLDGEHLKGVQSFKLKSKAENSYAELYLKLLVELPSDDNSNKEVEE